MKCGMCDEREATRTCSVCEEALCDECNREGMCQWCASERRPQYELSDNQKLFVRDAENQGITVKYDYSGRCMYGRKCPSVVVGGPGDFGTKAGTRSDSMGLDIVIYAPH
jgi:hypothetical protein